MKSLRSKLAKILMIAVAAIGLAGVAAGPVQAAAQRVVVVAHTHHRYYWHGRYYEHRGYDEHHHWRYY